MKAKEMMVAVALPRAHVVENPRSTKPALTPKQALAARAQAKQHGKAKRAEAPAKKAEAVVLAPEWLAAGWDEAVDVARAAGDAGPSLVDAWVAASNADAVAALAAAEGFEGPARKAARRALGILKSRGVAIPERTQVARVEGDGEGVAMATFVSPDPTGAASISITRRGPSGRYQIAEVVFRDGVGILDAAGGWISGSQIRESRARQVSQRGMAPAPVSVEWARHRIELARQKNAESKRVLPLGLDRCHELLTPLPEAEPPHPVADLEAAITSEQAWAMAASSAELHAEAEMRSWMPDSSAIEEMLRKLGERLGPEGVKDPDAIGPAMREEVLSATDRFFSPEVRAIIEARMRDAAISLRARKGDAAATQLLAAARAVREAGLITSPPRDVSFLVAMFDKAVAYLLQQGKGSLRIPVPASPPDAAT